MWATVLTYLVPALVSLYGVMVLVTGEVGGFGSRSVRGIGARVLGVLLLAALPLAIWLGPSVRIKLFASKPDYTAQNREIQITREIIDQHRQLREWREKNMPDLKTDVGHVQQREERTRALQEFEARYKQRAVETDARIQELRDEQARLHQEREERQRQQQEAAERSGAFWVGLGVVLCVWLLAWLVGRPTVHEGPPPKVG
jgi:hypothetical protein